jgi:hypothetical protein
MRIHAGAAAAAVILVLGACSSSSSTGSNPDTCTGSTITMSPLEVQTVPASSAPCVSMPADGSTYVVVPQYAGGVAPTGDVGYEIGTAPPAAQDAMPLVVSGEGGASTLFKSRPRGLQQEFDFRLREQERTLAHAARPAAPPQAAVVAYGPPGLGTTRIFDVCSDLSCGTFKKDTAVAQYVGNKIAIYISQDAPAPGLTAGDITALGNTFDQDLYPIDVNTFGDPSDLDNNQRVIVLMSPKINAITPSSQCATQGFVAGFFYGLDLTNQAHSNGGEIFYALVPDAAAAFSCAHSVATVKFITLPTFIHEFQHMISWNQHSILRSGNQEDTWLNEGMSHIAEELGSLYYENKYPPPTGRTDPAQLFPDSSQGFITGDLSNSYDYLRASNGTSVTIFANSGSLEERGAAWLFLRWLGDHKGQTIFGLLEQTALTGVANVEAQSGEQFPALFGDFSMAVYSDSLPGMPRASAPARDRYVSRNLRLIYNRIYTTSLGGGSPLPFPFPVRLGDVPIGAKTTSTLTGGTMEYWRVVMPSSGSEMRLHFAKQGGGSFPANYNAQLTVIHCPATPGACPQ